MRGQDVPFQGGVHTADKETRCIGHKANHSNPGAVLAERKRITRRRENQIHKTDRETRVRRKHSETWRKTPSSPLLSIRLSSRRPRAVSDSSSSFSSASLRPQADERSPGERLGRCPHGFSLPSNWHWSRTVHAPRRHTRERQVCCMYTYTCT